MNIFSKIDLPDGEIKAGQDILQVDTAENPEDFKFKVKYTGTDVGEFETSTARLNVRKSSGTISFALVNYLKICIFAVVCYQCIWVYI